MLPKAPPVYQADRSPQISTSAEIFEQELKADLIGNQVDSEKSYAREVVEAWKAQTARL
ncbi:hypothetical protein NIES2104_30620 [Leptolyngbya sp. NIES-2104]|nr:hypothetical protein NIES2104_30620 [Leptolyngbya sp. NIES-2104]